jgi:peptide-methionine (S)-S-oxide reductase
MSTEVIMPTLSAIALLLTALMVPAMASESPARSSIVLGGGCFWCVEAAFEAVPGVTAAVSGYAGGTLDNPTYEQVCDGDTGQAEVVRVEFDPAVVSLDKLLDLFFHVHDPTTKNSQGNDHGTQYRSMILVSDAAQREVAQAAIAKAQKRFTRPIVTEVVNLATTGAARFHEAEAYHQDYFRRNPNQGYCRATIPPKLEKVRKFLEHGE